MRCPNSTASDTCGVGACPECKQQGGCPDPQWCRRAGVCLNVPPKAGVKGRPNDCTPNSYCADMNAGRPCACFPAQQSPEGYMEAFYEMAAMLGIEGAQAKSPEQVYREQVKPALEALKQRAANAEAAYLNMREWAEQNGLDTTARNAGAGGTDADQRDAARYRYLRSIGGQTWKLNAPGSPLLSRRATDVEYDALVDDARGVALPDGAKR